MPFRESRAPSILAQDQSKPGLTNEEISVAERRKEILSRTNNSIKDGISITDEITERRFGNLQKSINESEKEEPVTYNTFSMKRSVMSPKTNQSNKRQEYVKTP